MTAKVKKSLHAYESLKEASNYFCGTILEGLADVSTGSISADDQQLVKFHGTYLQDERGPLHTGMRDMARVHKGDFRLTANQNLVIARVAPEDRKQILETLRPILVHYAKEREDGERFGDFCIRTGYTKPTRSGATFHDDVPVEAIAK